MTLVRRCMHNLLSKVVITFDRLNIDTFFIQSHNLVTIGPNFTKPIVIIYLAMV